MTLCLQYLACKQPTKLKPSLMRTTGTRYVGCSREDLEAEGYDMFMFDEWGFD